MYVVTGDEMRAIDTATIERFVPGLTLMERAGQGVFERIKASYDSIEGLAVSIFLGRGNNAGDGLVVARLLAEAKARVILHYLHEPKDLSPDAFKNFARLKELKKANTVEENFLYLADWKKKTQDAIDESDLIVDSLLGTGISKPVTKNYASVIELMNDSGLPILAIDIPSGVHATTGEVMGTAVRADYTVTMALPKLGSLFYPGKEYSGGLSVVDIGVPDEVIEEQKLTLGLIDFMAVIDDLPVRNPAAHKFRCGSLLLVAGSKRYTGAASLAAVSALRTGCGIVYCAGPESVRPVVQTTAPEVIFIALPETASGTIAHQALGQVLEDVRFDALAVGPGLTTDGETVRFVRDLVERTTAPVLIDADGINAFAGDFETLKAHSAGREIVISPHSGELARLTGIEVPGVPQERIERLRSLIAGTGITLVHKGAPTVALHPDGTGGINAFGHPGQATAGSGDVLTGTIAGFLAQGCGAAPAVRLGVYLHSRAADLASMEVGQRAMIAGDMMRMLGAALREIEEERGFR
jgi:NAD(P)H-hydrate epimerase